MSGDALGLPGLVFGVGGADEASGEVVGVRMRGAVGELFCDEASADVPIPVGAVSGGIVEVLEGTAVAPVEDGALLHGIDHEDAFPERVVEEPGPAVVAGLALETIGVRLKNRVKGTGKCSPSSARHPKTPKNRRIFVKIRAQTPSPPPAVPA